MLRVALLGMGGSNWIAGAQYLHSILYGNSLLPANERASLRLYLDREQHRASDFRQMQPFSCGIEVTEFYTATASLYRRVGQIARTVVQHRKLPARPVFDLPALLHKHQTEVLFAGTSLQMQIDLPQICWIPDFQHVHRPEFFSAEERHGRDEHFARIMATADRVIVSNQCSYEDAARLYPGHRAKLAILPFTMYLGSSLDKRAPQAVVRKYKLPDKFLLFPGQFWKHKNHLTAFRAIQLIRESGHKDVSLVCTGLPYDPRFPDHAGKLRDFLRTHQLNGAVRILGLLPRDDQVQLMRAAAAIIQPSLFEGWSAVVEEARSLGKTVFASDIPMHREQLSDEVHLFPHSSPESLADLVISHWPKLTARPGLGVEPGTNADYQVRIAKFAKNFVAICAGLVGSRESLSDRQK